MVKALLEKKWNVRALTRKPDNATIVALKNLGAEIVVADIDKAEDVTKAFTGANAVFAVTNFYEAGADGEVRQGKLLIDIAKQQNVGHFIFSSLENSVQISGGKNKVPHFTSKANVHEYLFASGLPGTAVEIACYYENWATWFLPKPNSAGVYEFTLSVPNNSKIALGSVADLGPVVAEILEEPAKYVGKRIAVAGDYLTPDEIAAAFQKVWGKPVRANIVPDEVFGAFPFPHAGEFADMFNFFHNFGYFGEKTTGRDIWEGKKIYPNLITFEQYIKANIPTAPQ